VTYPLETALAGIPGLTTTRSLSRNGFSQVTAIFTDATDIYFARQQVAERMREAAEDLPDGASPMLSPVTTGLGEVLMWTVDFTTFDPAKLAKPGEAGWQAGEVYRTPEGNLLRTPEERATYLRTVQDWIIAPQMRSSRAGRRRYGRRLRQGIRRASGQRGWPRTASAWPTWSPPCSVPTCRPVPVSCSVPAKAWWCVPMAWR
jgi:hypothetical protein